MKYLMVGGPEYQTPEGRYALRTEDDIEDSSTLVALRLCK